MFLLLNSSMFHSKWKMIIMLLWIKWHWSNIFINQSPQGALTIISLPVHFPLTTYILVFHIFLLICSKQISSQSKQRTLHSFTEYFLLNWLSLWYLRNLKRWISRKCIQLVDRKSSTNQIFLFKHFQREWNCLALEDLFGKFRIIQIYLFVNI